MKHPLLEKAHVREPCSADWNEMSGDDRVRHCDKCKKDVYDLAAFDADEAEALLAGASGRICIIPLRRLVTVAATVAIATAACGKSQVTPAPDALAAADAGPDAARRPGCYCQPGDPLCSCL